ncbi:MAG: hypothetical protein ACW99J_18120, partial [Candidatus Thorarchaeota archaeon]
LGITQWTGESSPLDAAEFGNRSDSFPDTVLEYYNTNTTTQSSLEVPTGSDWEAHSVNAEITELSENRTWFSNPDFTDNASSWTLAGVGAGGSSYPIYEWLDEGHGTGDDSLHFEIESTSGGPTYWYNANDAGYATQSVNVPRGAVEWAAFRLDYWADTEDDTHYGMTGSFSIYIEVEGTVVWELVFDAIEAEETWYDSGLIPVPTSVFNLPTDQTVTFEIGLLSKESVGYAPEIAPHARVDNIVLYMKSRATPSSVNLEMDGVAVSDNAGYGSGSITVTPSSAWTANPVLLNFSWTPTPVNPDPNMNITVEYDVTTNMFARRTIAQTVYEITPDSYGERFSILNGTDATYTSYYYANIPDGYPNRYFFNLTLPSNRDVFFVARPLAPSTNLTSGWTGGESGDGYVNVSAYDVATEAGRYGYWRVQSSSSNMITDVELYDPEAAGWDRYVTLRAGNDTQVRVNVGASYTNSEVNVTIFDSSGTKWHSENATVDGSGYATTTTFNLAGSNASAGEWMVQVATNDVGTGGDWRSTGFFKRPFSVIHSSVIDIDYPDDAVGTWLTNVTFGDLMLVVINASDIDSGIVVPGGTLELNWVLGKDTFDDSGNGQYTKVIDTSLLPGKGQYLMDLDWSHSSYDNATGQLTMNVNYAATLTSPDYPGIQGPVGANQTFSVTFANVNGTGITNAIVACNWSGPYDVTAMGAGVYEIELDTTGIGLDVYPVSVTAVANYVEPATMLMYVEIREVYNTVAYSANQLSIPVGEAASFSVTWTDSDSGLPVTGGAGFISCNWTSFHSLGEQNYTVNEVSPGQYNVTIYTESDDPLSAADEFYAVIFNVERQNYQNHTFQIGVIVRSHNTLFVLDEPVQQTPYGEQIVVLVNYRDTDLSVGIDNSSSLVRLTVSSPGVVPLTFTTSASSLGTGHYNITIVSDQWGSIGWKNLTIFIEWTGAVTKYYNQTIETSVRVLGTETDLYLELAPTATTYLDESAFSAVYWDAINGSRISNTTNDVFLTITPITGGHGVTQTDFVISESVTSPGTYEFTLNTSLFGQTGSFQFEFAIMWSAGVNPFYENQTMTVTLVVLGRPTYIDYAPVQATPYNENAEFSFSLVDSLSTSKIQNSSQLLISLNEGSVVYTLAYFSSTRTFVMTINTSSLGGIGPIALHLNLTWTGDPFYQSIGSQAFTVTVTLRSTQLSHFSFAPGQWGQNVSIEFVYTDLVSGSSLGMTGLLTLNASLSGWYDVVSLGGGHYLVVLNTSGFVSDGIYVIDATITYIGSNNAADATEIFGFVVLNRGAQLGYESPDPAPYLTNVTFSVNYVDDTTGEGISGASVVVSCDNSSEVLLLNTNYWITYEGSGIYLVQVNTSSLGAVGTYVLNVTVTKAGTPFYLGAIRLVNSRVTERTTQIFITQTPGDVPFLANVTFRFQFEDYLSGNTIAINKTHITLSHGPSMTTILSGQYALADFGTYYEISFNSTVVNPSSLVAGHSIQLLIDKSSGEPFYSVRNTSTVVTTIERPTQILFPSIEDTAYFDNITITLEFADFLTGVGIEGASIQLDVVNTTTPTYFWEDLGGGAYRVLMPSTQFAKAGVVLFNVTLSKAGAPFFAERTTVDVPASIRLVQTSLLASTPAPGVIPVGDQLVVNLTLTDTDHELRIESALLTSSWSLTDFTILEIGNGVYSLSINTTGLVAQSYLFTVQAEKSFYAIANITVSVQPGSATVEINLERTAYFADWGEVTSVRFTVVEPYRSTTVPGMNATLLWNGTLLLFNDLGNGTYSYDLDTAMMNFGIFEPQITVSRQYYQTRQKSFALVVSKATGQIVPESSLFDVVIDTDVQFWIYLNDTSRNQPVIGASLIMEWADTPVSLAYNGTPGFYLGDLNVSGSSIGPYELELTAVAGNFVFLQTAIDIRVVPVPTEMSNLGLQSVYHGDILNIILDYNDTLHGGRILGANVTFSLGNLTGSLVEQPNGTYSTSIDTSQFSAGTGFLRITASKDNFTTLSRNFVVTILHIPTLVDASIRTQLNYSGRSVSFLVYFNDTRNNAPVSGASLRVEWTGGTTPVWVDLGNGFYNVTVDLGDNTPGFYDVRVSLAQDPFVSGSITLRVVIIETPAEIKGPDRGELPVLEQASYQFNLTNSLTGALIPDQNGNAEWEGLGVFSLVDLGNGYYNMSVPEGIPIRVYRVTIDFPFSTYAISPFLFDLHVLPIRSQLVLTPVNTTIYANTAGSAQITLVYRDSEHGIPIYDAEYIISSPTSTEGEDYEITGIANGTEARNGVWEFTFSVSANRTVEIIITLSKDNYEPQTETFRLVRRIAEEQALIQTYQTLAGFGLLFLAGAIVAYVRHFSVPKVIRALNKMIKALRGGRLPKPYSSPTRADL